MRGCDFSVAGRLEKGIGLHRKVPQGLAYSTITAQWLASPHRQRRRWASYTPRFRSACVHAAARKMRRIPTQECSMKRLALIIALAAAGFGAAHAQSFVDNARVRSVEPQYESVAVPRNECTSQLVNEVRRTGGGRDYGGAVLGGVA